MESVMQVRMGRASIIHRLSTMRWPMRALRGTVDGAIEQPMSRETDLPRFWHDMGYAAVVEIGVERAHYTKHLLKTMPEAHVWGVDPWHAYPGYREHVSQEKLDGFYAEAQARVAPFGSRAHLLKTTSVEAAAGFDDETIDVVYIDGNHTLPFVIADLHAWTRKVRPGGMVCGHDYGRKTVGHVREAVMAWVAAYEITPWFLFTADRSWSWGFVK